MKMGTLSIHVTIFSTGNSQNTYTIEHPLPVQYCCPNFENRNLLYVFLSENISFIKILDSRIESLGFNISAQNTQDSFCIENLHLDKDSYLKYVWCHMLPCDLS